MATRPRVPADAGRDPLPADAGRDAGPAHVDLDLSGMTCASCAARIEKRLNRLDGVTATVNFATERAAVDYDRTRVAPDELVAAVEAIGYGASPPAPAGGHGAHEAGGHGDPGGHAHHHEQVDLAALRRRLVVSAVLTVPVLLMAMVPALQVRGWQWLSLALTIPVVTWGAWPFHRAAWTNLRHGAAGGAGFEVAPGQEEHRHRRGHLEVQVVARSARGGRERERHRHPELAGAAEEQRPERPAERGQNAE